MVSSDSSLQVVDLHSRNFLFHIPYQIAHPFHRDNSLYRLVAMDPIVPSSCNSRTLLFESCTVVYDVFVAMAHTLSITLYTALRKNQAILIRDRHNFHSKPLSKKETGWTFAHEHPWRTEKQNMRLPFRNFTSAGR